MGWTWTCVPTQYKNGRVFIDRKAECDSIYTWSGENTKMEVIKSAMVGAIYYAAVKVTRDKHNQIFGAVCITSTNLKEYYNFGYKDMDETCGPYHCDCPKGILDLLTPTDSEYANEWRKTCYENLERKKEKNSLSKLPVGSEIKYTKYDGSEVIIFKHDAAYQFKRPFWMLKDRSGYISQKHIPSNYEVIKKGGI